MSRMNRIIKRVFDLIISFIGLMLTCWVILLAWLISVVETKSNGFFTQTRVGQSGKLFKVIKIKTMKKVAGIETTVTSSNDTRITKSGKFFRNTKIDELPQLWNVLVGDMSLVGPRPDVPGYADNLVGKDKVILSIRPGITGPASLKYKNEEGILEKQLNPKEYNDKIIWPDKVKINRRYVEDYSFMKDLKYIIWTVSS